MKLFSLSGWIFFIALLAGCAQKEIQPVEEIRFLMDTVVRISVYDDRHSEPIIQKAIQAAFNVMDSVEQASSIHIKDSEISRLVQAAGNHPVVLSPSMFSLMQEAVRLGHETSGAFDCSIGAVKELWPFQLPDPVPPSQADIAQAVKFVDYKQIQFRDQSVYLPYKGMVIDLGGIAKGLAIDRAIETLRSAGLSAAIVDAGGDLRIFGSHPRRKKWGVGIRHPRGEGNALYAALRIDSTAVATSGDYERGFDYQGQHFHHLLDPETGYPVQDAVSVTIVAPTALLADAYATAVFIMGPDRGLEFIETHAGIEGVIVFIKEGQLHEWVSSGLNGNVEF